MLLVSSRIQKFPRQIQDNFESRWPTTLTKTELHQRAWEPHTLYPSKPTGSSTEIEQQTYPYSPMPK